MQFVNILMGTTVVLAVASAAFAFVYDEWFGAAAVFLVAVAHQFYLIGKRRRELMQNEAASAWQKKV